MFTQKSTLIFVQIEFCVFFFYFLFFSFCLCVSFVAREMENAIRTHKATFLQSKCQAYAWQWDDDDDGWRAFYWNFYVGQESCGGTCIRYICIRNYLTHKAIQNAGGASKKKRRKNCRHCLLASFFVEKKKKYEILISQSAQSTTRWTYNWKSYSANTVSGSQQSHRISERKRLFIYTLISLLFVLVSCCNTFFQIQHHQKSGKNANKIFIVEQEKCHALLIRRKCAWSTLNQNRTTKTKNKYEIA